MNRYRRALAAALRAEAKAYGFTLVVWGAAALCAAERDFPSAYGAVAYVGGALGAMALIMVVAFGLPPEPARGAQQQYFGFGGIHVLAVPVALGIAWALSATITSQWLAFLVVGFVSSLAYQLLLGCEVWLSESSQETEDANHKISRRGDG
jgi:hypothetical protein